MTSIKQRFNTIVIDGDMLCYLASFPTQSERFFVTTLEGDSIIDYPSLKSCESYLIKNNINIENCIVSKEKIAHKNWEYIARTSILRKVETWKREVGASHVIIALGETNFRDRLSLLYNKYKDRDSSKKPLKLKEVRAMIKTMYPCEMIDDLEADDIISMYQFRRI